jgi:alpha-L-glutamate ligase-like protein
MIAALRRLRAEVLGLNRRNHEFLFVHNARGRYGVVDDKRATKVVLAEHGVPAPALLHICDRQGGVRALGARLDREPEFAMKPARGAGGAGIVVVVERDGARFVKASGARVGRRDLEAHACDIVAGCFSPRGAEDAVLVEERVVADPVLGALAWRGVPDVRVVVFQGVPLLAMLRLPTRRSDGRANLHLGGVGVGVELASGGTTHGVVGRRPVDVHPDSGIRLAGVTVPCWDDVLDLAARAADAVGLGLVGVDVVVDARRGPLVLELNARPGLAIQLANRRGLRPLLAGVDAVPVDVAARVALGRRIAGAVR